MNIFDNTLIEKLDIISDKILVSVENSRFSKELEVFENVQVHAGCGGCSGTQMTCSSRKTTTSTCF